ncbi:hypothetical protein CDO43_32915, partial [Pseudomonas aeruginosa]
MDGLLWRGGPHPGGGAGPECEAGVADRGEGAAGDHLGPRTADAECGGGAETGPDGAEPASALT